MARLTSSLLFLLLLLPNVPRDAFLIDLPVVHDYPRQITDHPKPWAETVKTEYDTLIKAAVAKHLPGYDWRLLKAQYYQESRLDPMAVSPAGAVGIAQFMPATWGEWSVKAGYANSDRTDAEASIMTGAAYMAHLISSWHSPRPDIDRNCLAMASYNAGFGNLLKAQKAAGNPNLYADIIKSLPKVTGDHSKETITYVRRTLGYCNDLITGDA